MVGGEGAELDRQPCPSQGDELIGVDLERKSQRPGGGENAARLPEVEDPLLAKDIDEGKRASAGSGIPPGADRRQHRFTDQLDVGLRSSAVFLGDGMGAEKRWNELGRAV